MLISGVASALITGIGEGHADDGKRRISIFSTFAHDAGLRR